MSEDKGEEGKEMGMVVSMPSKKRVSLTQWLNSHAGCDFEKMIKGDPKELKRSEAHFQKKTLIARSKYVNDQGQE